MTTVFEKLTLRGAKFRRWPERHLAALGQAGNLNSSSSRSQRGWITSLSAIIFVLALFVRFLHLQDNRSELMKEEFSPRTRSTYYFNEVDRMVEDGSILFPNKLVEPHDARMIVHPPGYSILMLTNRKLFGESYDALRLAQIVCDGAAAVLTFSTAAELLPLGVAIIAGILVSLSPHLAYNVLWLGPDTLSPLPILIAIYLIIKVRHRPRCRGALMASGAMVGLSCWLRSDAMLLAPFLAVVVVVAFERSKRLKWAAAVVLAAVVVIAPITIRNWVVYHRFIPLSLGSGILLMEGVGDYDADGRFGLPATDHGTRHKEAEWYHRPDYEDDLFCPDGIERDDARLARGLSVIRSNPIWFLGVMLRRAGFMLKYNDSENHRFPFNTNVVPIMSRDLPYNDELAPMNGTELVWSNSPTELLSSGLVISPETQIALQSEGQFLQVIGDGSEYGDQLASAPLPVRRNTRYSLTLAVQILQGHMAAKVTSLDRRYAIATAIILDAQQEPTPNIKQPQGSISSNQQHMRSVRLSFDSGNREAVRLVMSNNGPSEKRSSVQIGSATLAALGPTPYAWTRNSRLAIHAIQRDLFTTPHLLPVVILGTILLLLAKRARTLLILLALPIYFCVTHSVLHLEYRYILAIHYFLFVVAAVAIYCAVLALWQILYWAKGLVALR